MPGLVGLITKMPRRLAEAQLLQMVEALRHEPFYKTGIWIDESLGVYVGWVARANSFSADMPVRNERGDAVLIFSGEEYSEPDTVRRLTSRGHTITRDDAEYLIHLYEEDASFPAGLNGRFHGLLVDYVRGAAILFNDRYGLHRLYYHDAQDGFYFGAEAKAILAVRPELRRVDPQALGEFVACGCVLEDRSLFVDTHVLPPASAWAFRRGAIVRRGAYFHPGEWETQDTLEPEPYYRELRRTFALSLPRYFGGAERVAMSLTGGLDTRMIMAWHRPEPWSLPCYTFGGMFRDCRDVVIAREVARTCRQPHVVITVGRDFLTRFDRYAERTVYMTDGCADVSRSPDLFVNEQARTLAPVRVTGNYGGELLRRVRAFKPVDPLPGLFQPELLSHVRGARDRYARLLREHPLTFAAFRQAPWHHYGLLALEQTQLSLRSPYLDDRFVRTAYRAPQSTVAGNDVSLRLIGDGNGDLRRIRTDRGLAGTSPLTSMASRGMQEFLFKAEYAYAHGMPQWFARIDHALEPLRLERLFVGRHKFYHFRLWYRDALAKYVREVLLDGRSLARPYVNPGAVRRIVDGHLTGRANHTGELHKLLTLELIHRRLIEDTPAAARPVLRAV